MAENAPHVDSGPKASMSSSYTWRLLLLAGVFLLYASWSAYDGFVGYPRINRIAAAFQKYQDEHPSDWHETWPEYARKSGLPETPDGAKSVMSLKAQYAYLAICLPIGLASLLAYIRSFGRWIAAEETGLYTSWGQRVVFNAITTFNKERWRTKGIAVVQYREGGSEKRLVLDDWKYDRRATAQLVELVEAHLTSEQITGDIKLPMSDQAQG